MRTRIPKRRYCLCDGEYVGIENFFNVIEGKNIYVDNGMIEKYKKLGREKKLYCQCGCGANLFLVAGQNSTRVPFFRIESGFAEDCADKVEDNTSAYSKIILRCWMLEKLQLQPPDILARPKIRELSEESNRKYELTLYTEKRNTGIAYFRNFRNIDSDKLEVLREISGIANILYVCTEMNNTEADISQYPLYYMEIQRIQGYCIFLRLKDIPESKDKELSKVYESAELVIRYNRKDRKGLWNRKVIAKGKILEFDLINDELRYNGKLIKNLVADYIGRVEYEELLQENREKAMQEQLERELAEQERRKEEKKRQKKEAFAFNYPKITAVYDFMQQLEWIEGDFAARQTGAGVRVYRNHRIYIKSVDLDMDRYRIFIQDTSDEMAYLYIKENDCKIRAWATGKLYSIYEADIVSEKNVLNHFQRHYGCKMKNEKKICELGTCQHLNEETMECGYEKYCPYCKKLL